VTRTDRMPARWDAAPCLAAARLLRRSGGHCRCRALSSAARGLLHCRETPLIDACCSWLRGWLGDYDDAWACAPVAAISQSRYATSLSPTFLLRPGGVSPVRGNTTHTMRCGAARNALRASRKRRIACHCPGWTFGSSAPWLTASLRCALGPALRCCPCAALRVASRYDADMRDFDSPRRRSFSRSPSRSRSPRAKREDASPARKARSASRSRSPPRRRSRSRSSPEVESLHISSEDAAFVLGKVRDVAPTTARAAETPGFCGVAAAWRGAWRVQRPAVHQP